MSNTTFKNILVSGASGIVGYGILRSLRMSGKHFTLFGTSTYEDSAAQGFCDIFEKAIPTNHENYIGWLVDIISKHHIALIVPGIEADMFKWAAHLKEIEESGAKVLVNDPKLISLCMDKWHFYEDLYSHDSPQIIDTTLSNDFDELVNRFGLPFLLKPRKGFGSKGIVIINSRDEFQKHQHYCGPELMAQPIIGNDDEEFTTAAFGDGKGGFFASMTLNRKLAKDGYTEKATVVINDEINEVVKYLCKIYQPLGPTNFQFRKHEGKFKLLEINPRVSSSTSIRTAFGYNESLMAVEYFLENIIPAQPVIRMGKAVRYIDDMIFYS